MLQRNAIEIFHGDKRFSVLFPDVVDGADVWMIQRRRRLCFSLEAHQCLRVFCDIVRQEFQGHAAVQPSVFALVDNAHTPTTELLDNSVVGNGLADERVGVRHSAAILGWVLRLSQRIAAIWGQLSTRARWRYTNGPRGETSLRTIKITNKHADFRRVARKGVFRESGPCYLQV